MKSSLLSPPSTEKSMLRPELPPNETAVIRALVGSEGSTGAVNGAIKEMLAKLRAESGISSRSTAVMADWMAAEEVSSGWVAKEAEPSTMSTSWREEAGESVKSKVDCRPIKRAMRLVTVANPEEAALTE